ncbi:MAG: EAL domain-containing response regulator, partial [Acidobacteriota bacterium]|nr:EAL domain-containing response regulator [Acidobacteriota bacterium]
MSGTPQCILLVDDDRDLADALSCALERRGRTIVLCSDIESAEVVLSCYPVTHLLTDIQFSGRFGFEGLSFVQRVHARSPQCRVIAMTGLATADLQEAVLQNGASALLAKPFGGDELELALDAAYDGSLHDDPQAPPCEVLRIPSIEELLRGDTLMPVFQPIVRLKQKGATAFGYEALMRVRGRWLACGPLMLFDYASRCSKLAELNIVAMTRALHAATLLPEEASIFINIDPLAFDGRELVPALVTSARRASLPLERIVVEITERSAFPDDLVAGRVFDELHAFGVRFALDDHGTAYSHLSLIDRIKPSFVKVSNSFGTNFENDPTKECIVRHTVSLANDFGCETILEGIETPATARAARDAGVTLAQGYHFGRPRAVQHWAG